MAANGSVMTRARTWATANVKWGPARQKLRRAGVRMARMRGATVARLGRVPEIANVYSSSSPKAGSQWMKALFDHPIVRSHTGLFTMPQAGYGDMLTKGFPLGTFVPGLYMGYDDYASIPKPASYRTIYMFRDPRDIVVSAYYGARRPSYIKFSAGTYEQQREKMRELPMDEGLFVAIDVVEGYLRDVASWAEIDDPNVATFKLEDVAKDNEAAIVAILAHAGVTLSPDEQATVVAALSKDAMRAKDLKMRKAGDESHYRQVQRTWRDDLTEAHLAKIEEIVPGLVARLGYDS